MSLLRQLVAQLEDIFYLYGSVNNPFHLQLPCPRWCAPNEDDDGTDKYCGFMIADDFDTSKICKSPPSKKCKIEYNDDKMDEDDGAMIVMHEELWKQLPEDLLEAVVARLPITSFFRFRSVCRKWNSLPNSLSFSKHFAEATKTQPWFYITYRNIHGGAAYDPSSMKWHQLGIPTFPARALVQPVASAGGLLCLLDIGDHIFYICNPLNKSYKELPIPARSVKSRLPMAVGMAFNRGGYSVLWVTSDGDYNVYDSKKNSWAHPGSMPANIKLPLSLNFISQTISVNNIIYLTRDDPEGIISYDASSGEWKQYIIPSPVYLSHHTLAECDGRIMLAGLVSKNAATCLCVWELQRMTLLWKEVDRMPNIWCLDFYGKHVNMTSLGNKGSLLLCLTCQHTNLLVTYNLNTREWVKIPVHTFGCCKGQFIARGAAFYPCITSLP